MAAIFEYALRRIVDENFFLYYRIFHQDLWRIAHVVNVIVKMHFFHMQHAYRSLYLNL